MRFPHVKLDKTSLILGFLCLGLFLFAVVSSVSTAFAKNPQSDIEAVSEYHFVTIHDEGKKLTIKTDAQTVADALKYAKISFDNSDIIEPALDTKIDSDNFFINIYRAHPLIFIDGKTSKYVMTPSRDPKTAAEKAGIAIYDGDEIQLVKNSRFLEVGSATIYQIIRHGGRTITVEVEIPFEEEIVKDYTIGVGNREVRQLGEVGTKKSVYQVSYIDNQEVLRHFVSEEITKQPVKRIVAIGASPIEMRPLTAAMGRNRYTVGNIERQETFYDLPMRLVMKNNCGAGGKYSVRADGVKIDPDGYVIVAANLDYYPRCSIVETSLGQGKVYDTGSFALENPEQFDIATDWTNRNGV